MKAVVIGAGAWGLPAAAELARRGHTVQLLDRYGPANQLSSSSGLTRIWRVSHPDRLRTRLALRSVEAWQRLAAITGITVTLQRGLVWRDERTWRDVADSLEAEGVPYTLIDPDDVGRWFPGLRPDGRPAVWQKDAGPVLANHALDAQVSLLALSRGELVTGARVLEVDPSGTDVVVRCADGRTFDADVVVIAAGPGAEPLLRGVGVDLALRPVLEQVCHVGRGADTDGLPCIYEGPIGDEPGMYGMPTPGRGYKLGIDLQLRDFHEDDHDRVPDPAITAAISARAARSFATLDPTVIDGQVCTWTDSPDGRFVLDTVHGGRVVVAAGDSGEGFKYSALMGPLLADLAEGVPPDPDVAALGLARFARGEAVPGGPVPPR
ncbi:MAG TPA: FAD-dependent oxidoreductase [Candidatus Nanopelagicales bacterium]|nr:FAD-dependent oxidoreductase [Candidatus Nanopelagicales bacterium]